MDPLTLPHRLTAAHPPSGKLTERIDISPGKHALRCSGSPTNSGGIAGPGLRDTGPHGPHQAGLTCHNPNPPVPIEGPEITICQRQGLRTPR